MNHVTELVSSFFSCEVVHKHLLVYLQICSGLDDTKGIPDNRLYQTTKLILGQRYKEQSSPFVAVVQLLSIPPLLLLRSPGRRTGL